jgi:hypothetical protein
VAELLEVAQLAHEDGVAEVEVRRGGVEAGLDAKGGSGVAGLGEALLEGFERDDLGGTLGDEVELVFYGGEVMRFGHDGWSDSIVGTGACRMGYWPWCWGST